MTASSRSSADRVSPTSVDRILAIRRATVTLHVGLGTFRPVEVEDLTKHRMDSENYTIPRTTAESVNRALNSPTNYVTAIGTTTLGP